MPYYGSIIILSIVDVTVISDIPSVGLVASKLNLCVYVCMHLWSEAGISLVSALAVQAM